MQHVSSEILCFANEIPFGNAKYYVGSFAQTSKVLFVVMKNGGFVFPDQIKVTETPLCE